jgi:hypothetical protein
MLFLSLKLYEYLFYYIRLGLFLLLKTNLLEENVVNTQFSHVTRYKISVCLTFFSAYNSLYKHVSEIKIHQSKKNLNSFYLFHVDYVKDKKSIHALVKGEKNYKPYTDKLCAFRCLSLHKFLELKMGLSITESFS